MSSEKAEFIFEGDSTHAVSELYRLEEAFKRVKAELKKGTAESFNDNATWVSSLDPVAKRYVEIESALMRARQAVKDLQRSQQDAATARAQQHQQESVYQLAELDHYNLMSHEIEDINKNRLARMEAARAAHQQREAAALARDKAIADVMIAQMMGVEAAGRKASIAVSGTYSSGNRFRDVMGQMSYAVNDFLSVSGGLAERVRAIANNIQYAAMMIPGPWGVAINILTMATQAATAVGGAFMGSSMAAEHHGKAVKTMADFYKELKEDIDKASMAQEEFDAKKRGKENKEGLLAAAEEVEQKRQNLRNVEWWTGNKADLSGFRQYLIQQLPARLINAASNTWSGQNETQQLNMAKAELVNAQIKLTDLQKLSQASLDEQAKKDRMRLAEKILPTGNLSKVFETDLAKNNEAFARDALQKNIARVLPDNLKDVAPDIAKDLARKSLADLQGKRLAAEFSGKLPSEREAETAKEKADAARLNVEREREKHIGERHMTDQTRVFIANLEKMSKQLEIAYRDLETKAKGERKELDAKLLGPAPTQPPPPPQNRNAGL